MKLFIRATLLLFLFQISESAIVARSSFFIRNCTDTIYHDPFHKAEYSVLKSLASTSQNYRVQSPDGRLEVVVNVASDQISYSINRGDEIVLSPSVIDLILTTGNLIKGVECLDVVNQSVDEIMHFDYGERSNFRNNYNEITISLRNSSSVAFSLIFRVYLQGVAYQFYFPENENYSDLNISGEIAQYVFPKDLTAYIEPYNENGYTPVSLNGISRSLIPLTLKNDQISICINEAANDSYARIGLRSTGNNTLQSFFLGSNQKKALPFSCPWRYLVIGDTPVDLIENKEMIYGLSPGSPDDSNRDWIKPGKVFRCMKLTTEGGKRSVDFCVEMNMQYVMFDAGWYGLGYGQSKEKDPASDPTDVVDEIDMVEVCRYAEEKGIGVILYVNKVGWNYYDNQVMLDLYKSWGIKGIKLGFMDGYSSYGINQVYNIVDEAAKRQIFVNVHDEFRVSGMPFRYPNLLTAEGIKGNESTRNTGDHTTLLPFTRFLTGAADYTICYKGSDPNYSSPSTLGTSRAHQLALSVLFYSPLQHLFWYAKPDSYQIPVEVEFFKDIPTVWDDFHVATAEMGDYISMARKKGDNWFLSTIGDNTARNIIVPLDFLDAGVNYQVTVYKDASPETILKQVTSLEQLKRTGKLTHEGLSTSLIASGGEVCVFKPGNEVGVFDVNNVQSCEVYPNPSRGLVNIKTAGMQGKRGRIVVVGLDGVGLYERNDVEFASSTSVDLSSLPEGCYILLIYTPAETKSCKLIIKK